MKSIVNGLLIMNDLISDNVIVFDDTIVDIVTFDDYIKMYKDKVTYEIDAKGNYVSAGFIDVHTHGYMGFDTMNNDTSSISNISNYILKNGVTSFLPTTMTMSKDKIINALENVKNIKDKNTGAEIIGVHLEGPFINKKYKGAQSEDFIISPDFEFIDKYRDIIKIVTIAPEIKDATKLIHQFSDEINFSLGHTNATYDECVNAMHCGAKGVTHLFNAMTPMNHRELGTVGFGLTSDCYVEVICDNFHISSNLYNLLVKSKGIDKIILITDSIEATALDDGVYNLGGQDVNVKDGKCLLKNGTIAGSTLKLNEALKNFTKNTDLSLTESIKTVTINQAKYLNIDDKVGTLDKNKRANIVIMDFDFEIKKTIIKGEIVYEN